MNQVKGFIQNQRIKYIGIIDFQNPTGYLYNKNVKTFLPSGPNVISTNDTYIFHQHVPRLVTSSVKL